MGNKKGKILRLRGGAGPTNDHDGCEPQLASAAELIILKTAADFTAEAVKARPDDAALAAAAKEARSQYRLAQLQSDVAVAQAQLALAKAQQVPAPVSAEPRRPKPFPGQGDQ